MRCRRDRRPRASDIIFPTRLTRLSSLTRPPRSAKWADFLAGLQTLPPRILESVNTLLWLCSKLLQIRWLQIMADLHRPHGGGWCTPILSSWVIPPAGHTHLIGNLNANRTGPVSIYGSILCPDPTFPSTQREDFANQSFGSSYLAHQRKQ